MKLYKKLNEALKDRPSVRALKLATSGGALPPEIFEFTNLEELYLEGDLTEISGDLQSLSKLMILSLKSSQGLSSIAGTFRLSSLKNFKVIDTNLSRLDLPLGFFNSCLNSLTLKNTNLQILPDEISQLQGLVELNLSGNLLSHLPAGFTELKNLRRLNLDSNKFHQFPDLIRNLPKLHHLSLDQNPLSEEEKARVERMYHLHF
jgi:Leucine-rich repeat (LRR) protein